jgi:uncharacterized delta-60 repeat protein
MFNGGTLDPTFGVGGIARPELGFAASSIAVQADGKTVLVKPQFSEGGGLDVARLNVNGSIDKTFGGGDGVASVDFPEAALFNFVAIQSDGRIVVLGRKDHDFALTRLNTDGTLDSSFGHGGEATFAGRGLRALAGLAVQPDGKIVMAGEDLGFELDPLPRTRSNFLLARVNSDGSPDTSFGEASRKPGVRRGYVQTDFGGHDVPSSLFLLPSGRIVVGGTQEGVDQGDDSSAHKFLIARYNSNGTLDTRFDGDGLVGTKLSDSVADALTSLVVQRNGKVIAGGIANEKFALVRYNRDGSIDTSFAGGEVFADLSSRRDRVDSLLLADNGSITAVGTVDQNFDNGFVGKRMAAVQYLPNGQLDTSFGVNGVANFQTGNVRVRAASRTPGGKIIAAGNRGALSGDTTTLVRFNQATPVVGVVTESEDATELISQSGSIRVTRDAAYDFPTRVFLEVSGTATEGVDYTSAELGQLSLRQRIGGIGKSLLPRYYVDIPAGQSSVTARINVAEDSQLELPETLTWSPLANPAYDLGAGNAGHVTIRDNTRLLVNFQPAGDVPLGAFADVGEVFADRGNGLSYGWDKDNTGNTRIRHNPGSPDSRLDTLALIPKGSKRRWEIAVPNGMYTVHLVAGDPDSTNSVYKLDLEKRFALSGTPSGTTRWFERKFNIQVNDGRLTLSNHKGSKKNKIDFIDIRRASHDAVEGPLSGNIPVNLNPQQPEISPRITHKDRLFSQVLI